jgi:hypothetical protein
MIKNESLGDRLNDFKNKQTIPTTTKDIIMKIFEGTYFIAFVVLKMFVYGFGFKIIFHTDWTIWSVMCIGLGFDFLLTYIRDLIHNPNDVTIS